MESTESSRMKLRKIIYTQENVDVFIQDALKEEVGFPGKLVIILEPHGPVAEWQPKQQIDSNSKSSPETEHTDFEDFTVVGYKARTEVEKDSVEIKSIRTLKPIVFDVFDLSSFKRIDEESCNERNKVLVAFSLKDGSSIPSFQFQNVETFQQFLTFLKLHVLVKTSDKEPTLHLINEPEDPKEMALAKSFDELQLFNEPKPHSFTNYFRNPYQIMGTFAKVTEFFNDSLFNSNESNSSDYDDEKVVELLNEPLPRIHSCHLAESGYELITCVTMPPRKEVKREDPVTSEEWNSYIDSDGRIPNVESLKKRIFKGGLMHSIRSEAWKYLVGFYSFDETNKEREIKRKQKVDDYYRMKLQWKSMSPDQESRFAALRERRNLIEKDVSRTDRAHPFFEGENNVNIQMLYDILMTYCMYNFDLGYVQGMSDLLSPILVVMQNEADSFWCFAYWMEKIGVNFEMDQLGMMAQLQNLHWLLHFVDSQLYTYLENRDSGNLYFAFRWVLILFKRDFKFQDVMRIWEVLWTGIPCKNFHLLICLAILDAEKVTIMENNYGLTEILKHVNDMAYKLNLEETLSKAESIYHQILGCSEVTTVVQNILGITTKIVAPSPRPPSIKLEDNRKGNEKNIALHKTEKLKNGVKRESPPMSASSDEYVEIDSLCDYSFGLFT